MSSKCPVCKTEDSKLTPGIVESGAGKQVAGNQYSCKRCGDFCLEAPLYDDLAGILDNDIQKAAILSHWIRTRHESIRKDITKGPTILTEALVTDIIRNPRPLLPEQANSFVHWIGDNVKVGGEYVDVNRLAIQAIVGSVTFDEFQIVFGHLRDIGLIVNKTSERSDPIWCKVTLSYAGWERYYELKRATSDSRKAFMAMQYDQEQLDDIVESVFKPAVKQTGFDLFKLPDRPQPAGLIDDRIRVEIQTSRFLVADLTHGNAGAYWEAGYAEGLRKPVIYTCEKRVFEEPKSKPHFDTNHHLTILWEWDPNKRKEAGEKLKNTIRATLPAEAKSEDE